MDPAKKKSALRGLSTGAYVVGCKGEGQEVNAYLGTWVTQTSFDPPLVVIAVKVGNTSQEMIASSQVFSVNILDSTQKDLGAKFFKPMRRVGNKFEDVEFYTEVTGAPILTDALRFFECKVVAQVEQGDHWIYVGEVINAGVHRDAEPLTCRDAGWTYGG